MFFLFSSLPKLHRHASVACLLCVCVWQISVASPLDHSLRNSRDRHLESREDFFEKRIRPVLIEHCYECHGEKKAKGGLRLDLRDALRRGGDSGPAIVPFEPERSRLIDAVRYGTLEMPPSGKLPERVINDLVTWVRLGAPDPRTAEVAANASRETATELADPLDHWAFRAVEAPEPPRVRDVTWPLTSVDRFILRRLEEAGVTPAPDADRYTWLRRVSLDLTGLPPTVEELRDFHADPSPDAFETVVDRLLGSRAFGERWARHWLDLVGYADQIGTSNNVFAEHGWRYRDYVIDSLNADTPFDRFIREQIAGDLLAAESVEQRAAGVTATGFLLLGDLEIVEADKAKLHVDVIDQQIDKIGKAFLGLTVGCARCHDHKFDPIPQRDYYALAGIFHSTRSIYKTARGVWSDVTAVEIPETEDQKEERLERVRLHGERVAALKDERKRSLKRQGELDEVLERTDDAATSADDLKSLRAQRTKERDALATQIKQINRRLEHAEFFAPSLPRTYAVSDLDDPSDMRITIRGNPRALGDSVPRGFLTAVSTVSPPQIPPNESGRRQLADWIASARNPLTARVAVNRIWQKLFGRGLVPSVDYFGIRGEKPSHPDLLDALAIAFVEQGWSQKRLIRDLVLSRTYRMSSGHNARAHDIDPDNRLWWRMHRRRLDAESIRDAMLAVSGQLQRSHGGPALPLEYIENVGNIDPKNVNPPSFSLKKWRPSQEYLRTIYLPVIRSGLQPGPAELRNVFDFTQPALFAGKRPTTAVPTQALFLMNSAAVKKRAVELAERIIREKLTRPERIDLLWLYAFSRPITTKEREDAEAFLAAAGDEAWKELCHAILGSNEFLMRL